MKQTMLILLLFAISVSIFSLTGFGESSIFEITDDEILPVELSSFTAMQSVEGNAIIKWETQSETNLTGFNIYRSNNETPESSNLINHGIIQPNNTSSVSVYEFEDDLVELNTTYNYLLESVELDGNSNFYGPITIIIEDEDEDEGTTDVLVKTMLSNPYPNPFGPDTHFNLKVAENETAVIAVYNIKGQRIVSYPQYSSGTHEIYWDGKDAKGNELNSGIYFIKMSSETNNQIKKIMLIK